jgi:hypothetical protein
MHAFRLLLPLMLLLAAGAVPAQTVAYQCTGSDGRVTYQDKPCAKNQRQRAIPLPGDDAGPAAAPAPAPAAERTDDAAPPAPAAPPSPPAAPLPRMYACTHPTDGKTYLSHNGNPEPYLAPFGMLGAVQMPLSQAYGPTGGAGISAPEASRGKLSSGLVADNYVWVQDQCRPLSARETCHALQDAYDENARKLRRAFKSDRPPLEQQDEALRGQLAGCR